MIGEIFRASCPLLTKRDQDPKFFSYKILSEITEEAKE